jgi:hypothetical protein
MILGRIVQESGEMWTVNQHVKFQVLTAASMKMAVFWVVLYGLVFGVFVLCSLVEVYWHIRGACCHHHHHTDDGAASTLGMLVNLYQTTQCNNPEDNHKPAFLEKLSYSFSPRYHRCEFHLAVPPDSRQQQSSDAGQLIDVSPPGPIMVRHLSVKSATHFCEWRCNICRHTAYLCMYDNFSLGFFKVRII